MTAAVTQTLRKNALSIFQQGIKAADPYQAVKNSLKIKDKQLEIALDFNDSNKIRQGNWSKIHIIAFGKAACSMAKAAKEILSEYSETSDAIAITNYENVIAVKGVEVIGANHPIPDESGLNAARLIVNRLKNTRAGELVLTLISGGGSALLPLPAEGISLQDKQKTTDLLLASGADIEQINCVRKHLSQLKGGQLAEQASPADLHSLILSDVIGDDLSSIASGPTVADNSTFEQAINILTNKAIWDKIPTTVQDLLIKGRENKIKETAKADAAFFKNTSQTLIGSNRISLDSCLKKAAELGYRTELFSASLCGEASYIAEQLALYAKQVENTSKTNDAIAILAGGETTVTLTGNGLGGRNQEMALAFAIAAEKHNLTCHWTFLSGGTDGRDGPTDAAGGIVDPGTLIRMRQSNLNPNDFLKNNDSYTALKESQDLVIIGATGTNVADLQVLLIQPEQLI